MPELIAKHLKGWLSLEDMKTPEWTVSWYNATVEADRNNVSLTVFELPMVQTPYGYGADKDLLAKIEKLIQEHQNL